MTVSVAIAGMACRYADAASPQELWENVLAQRRAFRRLPPERLRVRDYHADDRDLPDRTYGAQAALITGYEFDRVRYRVSARTLASTDLAHWLALDVACGALADAGFPEGSRLPRETTGVIVGNTLTGEFSRANVMRLRWPYVRRVIADALGAEGWPAAQCGQLLERLEARYKAPFPPVTEDTLAGSLSNTIAGRICNHLDLKGGGFTIDGACASSLLAVCSACSALAAGDLDVAIAGGVDVSLDPFELVGFAKAGALAAGEMRVYDAHPTGFVPGEGCGFVVLLREPDARALGCRVYAVIRGWGTSSDGSGGITRPEREGQLLALRRAYSRAGLEPESIGYLEGHGTGTAIGDEVELEAIAASRESPSHPAAIGSIKANIGHTKAAAGIAGLIKATMAVHTQVLPPHTGCEHPHRVIASRGAALRVLRRPLEWPADLPLRAGVSAAGFGGINTHVVIEGTAAERRGALTAAERRLAAARQDCELILLGAATPDALRQRAHRLLDRAAALSMAELGDLAAALAREMPPSPFVRAAIVAATPADLELALQRLVDRAAALDPGETHIDRSGLFLGAGTEPPRVGLLFSGQASPPNRDGGLWRLRFEAVEAAYVRAGFPDGADSDTRLAQRAIVTACLVGLRLIAALGIEAQTAVGHSLGELLALYWAGAIDEEPLRAIVSVRADAMGSLASDGAMASVAAAPVLVERLLGGEPVVIAAFNGPHQTVIAGAAADVERVMGQAAARGLRAVRLPVSRAFHTPLMEVSRPPLAHELARHAWRPLRRPVFSTVTGDRLAPGADLKALLVDQITSPVRFHQAVAAAAAGVDLWLEVGPGRILADLAGRFVGAPVLPLDAGGTSLRPMFTAAGTLFAAGAPIRSDVFFADRFTRRIDLDAAPQFFASPCERVAPADDLYTSHGPRAADDAEVPPAAVRPRSALDTVIAIVARHAELPVDAISSDSRLLGDLHLNSIVVAQVVAEAARALGQPSPVVAPELANATVCEVAGALAALSHAASPPPESTPAAVAGVDAWVRAFSLELVERPAPPAPVAGHGSWHVFAAGDDHIAAAVMRALAGVAGSGYVLCLARSGDERDIPLMLRAAQLAVADSAASHFVVAQAAGGATALARTVAREAPHLKTCVLTLPLDHPMAADWIAREVASACDHVDVQYDAQGVRREPVLRALPLRAGLAGALLPVGATLLATGGGKGIGAECVLALARRWNLQVGIVGRARPEADSELASALEQFAAAGVRHYYAQADLTDREAVAAAVGEIDATLGPVSGLVHAAAVTSPRLIAQLDDETVRSTLAPKVLGLRHLLSVLDPARLRLLVTFGSVIARTGMRGAAEYAIANEWLRLLTDDVRARHAHCHAVTLEWSVWSGVGVGVRLGRVEALMREGVTPIPPGEGADLFCRLLEQRPDAGPVIVSGRLGRVGLTGVHAEPLPFLRYLEEAVIRYPDTELVVEAGLTAEDDPYVAEHVYQGSQLLPAVMGLEAMAQVTQALTGGVPRRFEHLAFTRAIVMPQDGTRRIRLAALAREDGCVDVALRSDETAFQLDHFRGSCTAAAPASNDPPPAPFESGATIDPDADLYGRLLFQKGRFRCVRRYRELRAYETVFEVEAERNREWFGPYRPPDLLLGDPGVRDAVIHGIQPCVPQATLLPVGVDAIDMIRPLRCGERYLVTARERSNADRTYVYDVVVVDRDGTMVETWHGLRLRAVDEAQPRDGWPPALLATYAERRLAEICPRSEVRVAILPELTRDRTAIDRRFQALMRSKTPVRRRRRGAPEAEGWRLSASHTEGLALVTAARQPVACDIETIRSRTRALWTDLLGTEHLRLADQIAGESGRAFDDAATRAWCAREILIKLRAATTVPVTLAAAHTDGWIVLQAGRTVIATFTAAIGGAASAAVVAVGCEPADAAASRLVCQAPLPVAACRVTSVVHDAP